MGVDGVPGDGDDTAPAIGTDVAPFEGVEQRRDPISSCSIGRRVRPPSA